MCQNMLRANLHLTIGLMLAATQPGCLLFSTGAPCKEDTNCRKGYFCDADLQECVARVDGGSSIGLADAGATGIKDGGSLISDSGHSDGDAGGMIPDGGDGAGDGGSVMPDGGDVDEDAGAMMPDGGDVDEDAGAMTPDGGDVGEDAGAMTPDGGDVGEDAGAMMPDGGDGGTDAGAMLLDGGEGGTDAGAMLLDGGGVDGGLGIPDGGTMFPDGGPGVPDGGDENPPACIITGFAYSMPISINNTGAALNNYSLELDVDTFSLISDDKMKDDCSDLRFVDEESSALGFYLESGCNTAQTKIWVRLPSLAAMGEKMLYMQYGHTMAVSESDPQSAFLFFDNFDNDNLFQLWTAYADDYQPDHDDGYGVDLSDESISDPYALALNARASCSFGPYDGIESYVQTFLDLSNDRYCIDFATRADVTDFLWNTTAYMRSIVFVDGNKILDSEVSCSGSECEIEGDWITQTLIVDLEIVNLRLGGRASDCTWGNAYFDDVRVRLCRYPNPSSAFGSEIDCQQ